MGPATAGTDPPAALQLIGAGWGYALLDPGSVQADNGAGLTKGIIGLTNKGQPRKPEDWVIAGTPQSKEAYAMMIRKGDDDFKKLVDETIAQAETSGEAAKLYQKWFQSPIPPKGLNLDLPLSDDMKELFKNPNDKAFQ